MSGESEQFKKGLAVRRDVLGKDYVDNSIAKADDFMMAFQGITTEWCWGYAWTRPGLDRKTRSLLNLAMLTALESAERTQAPRQGRADQRRDRGRDQGSSAARHCLQRHSRRS